MALAKFGVENFDSHNSFSLWCIKMRALLRQQGLTKILEDKVSDEPSISTKEEKKKAHSTMLLSLSDGILHEVVEEETTADL